MNLYGFLGNNVLGAVDPLGDASLKLDLGEGVQLEIVWKENPDGTVTPIGINVVLPKSPDVRLLSVNLQGHVKYDLKCHTPAFESHADHPGLNKTITVGKDSWLLKNFSKQLPLKGKHEFKVKVEGLCDCTLNVEYDVKANVLAEIGWYKDPDKGRKTTTIKVGQ